MMLAPPCAPGPDGALKCAPPPECGGAAFAGAGVQGCAPPPFCTAGADGQYLCKPPEDCRRSPDGRERCVGPAVGGACGKQLESVAAEGAFVPCAPAPELFCPPPPPGAPPTESGCRAPPPPPRFCAPGENQFKPDHPMGAPPVCMLPPKLENGLYVPPGQAIAPGGCEMPPPGEWPPAQPAPAGKVWCPPAGFAPPPQGGGEGFQAWRQFTADNAPRGMVPMLDRVGGVWAKLNETALADMHKTGAVHQLFAPPSFDGRVIDGAFLNSRFDEGLGMSNFSVGGTPFFREARPNVPHNASFSTVAGPAVVAAGGDVVVETHNVPSGILAYKSAQDGNYSVDLRPDAGYQVRREGGVLLMEKGDWKGVLVGEAQVGDDGAIQLDVRPDRPAFFMAVPPTGLESETRLDIAKGVAEGKVFAEMSLVQRNDTAAQDLTLYEEDAAFSVEVQSVSEDAVEVAIAGEGEGQALVFTVDRSTLTTSLSEFNVTMDGVLMRECATFEELTGSADEGGCFTLAANESVVRVSVMPEHFSEHVITFGAVGQEPESSEAPATDDADGSSEGGGADDATTQTPSGDGATTTQPTPDAQADTPGPGVLLALVAVGVAAVALGRRRRSG